MVASLGIHAATCSGEAYFATIHATMFWIEM